MNRARIVMAVGILTGALVICVWLKRSPSAGPLLASCSLVERRADRMAVCAPRG
jgi:hypothetical protein